MNLRMARVLLTTGIPGPGGPGGNGSRSGMRPQRERSQRKRSFLFVLLFLASLALQGCYGVHANDNGAGNEGHHSSSSSVGEIDWIGILISIFISAMDTASQVPAAMGPTSSGSVVPSGSPTYEPEDRSRNRKPGTRTVKKRTGTDDPPKRDESDPVIPPEKDETVTPSGPDYFPTDPKTKEKMGEYDGTPVVTTTTDAIEKPNNDASDRTQQEGATTYTRVAEGLPTGFGTA